MRPYTYFSDDQIQTALGQLMRALGGFQVLDHHPRNGEAPTYQRVPIVYGEMDRIIANVLQKGDTNTKLSVPMLSANLTAIKPDPENTISPYHMDEIVLDCEDSPKIMNRIHGPALKLTVDVSLWCSSRTELYQLLEQMLLVFNPKITINLDDTLQNPSYITQIGLESISTENSYPIGTSNSAKSITLSLEVPVRLHYPAQIFDGLTGIEEDNRFGPDKIRSLLIEQITTNIRDDDTGESFDTYATVSDEDMESLEEDGYVDLTDRTEEEKRTNDNGTTQKIDKIHSVPPKGTL